MDIPVIVVQDGLLLEHSMLAIPPVIADYAFVLGESGRRWFQEAGIKSDHILEVGPPLWGSDFTSIGRQNPFSKRSSTTKVLYLAPRPNEIGAQRSSFDAYEQIELVCQCLSLRNDLDLMIRFHPRWRQHPGIRKRKELVKRIRRISNNKIDILDEKQSLISALNEADLVISYPSTTCVQSAYLHKPVIMLEYAGKDISAANRNHDSGTNLSPTYKCGISDLPAMIDLLSRECSRFSDNWRVLLKEHVFQDCALSEVADFTKNIISSKG